MSELTRLTDDQGGGTDPAVNAWLSASAGTGKTQVLTARVLRLLLDGANPRSILCITFTKAGASEMARRIRERLARWVQLPDADLRKDLFAIHVRDHNNPAVLARARTLFAEVIDAPGGGLAIQTIHSFCQSLLASFPEEAGLAPGFRPLEEREIALLRRDVLADLVDSAPRTGDLAFLRRIEQLSLAMGEEAASAYLYRCAQAVDALESLPSVISHWLRTQFSLSTADPTAWAEGCCADELVDITDLFTVAEANRSWGTATGTARVTILHDWLAADAATRWQTLGNCLQTMVTAKGELRADYRPDKKLGHVGDLAARLAEQLGIIATTAAQMAASDRLADALEAGRHFARAFADCKRREGVVDFDDLIARAVALLRHDGRAEWIRYKLDARIDHILVDEAQDTNAAQWAIVRGLAEEFFAGEGAHDDAIRTLFVVGDFKQAIYGFQGTDPKYFEAARLIFAALGQGAERPFADLSIDINFRSSPPVLTVVDRLIETLTPEAMGLEPGLVRHQSHARGAPGRVVLWPLEPSVVDEASDPDGDDEPASEEGWIDSATRRVADRIARTVAGWVRPLDAGGGIGGTPVRAGDVMVLVRKRTDLAGLLVSRLQAHGVAVAGVDRLRLQTPIAVQDLLAAARFALQPLDDLNLASLLVSPLIGWSHDQLIDHGWRQDDEGRSGPLWPHLRAEVACGRLAADALDPLYSLLRMAGFVAPYRFFETILSGPMQGRARLLARLGNAARDPIEELVSQALAFETREGASLHQFLRWFDMGAIDIKREVDSAADEVRVMTVHGAKGLQAPIVILADAAVDPMRKRAGGLTWDHPEVGKLPLIGIGKEERPEALRIAAEQAEAAELREHWRLLYVAMTRAERMLFVAGALGAKQSEAPEHSWYARVEATLAGLGCEWEADAGLWARQRALVARGREPARDAPRSAILAADLPIPEWARRPAPVEARPSKPLAPSSLGDIDALDVAQPPPGQSSQRAADRGRVIHALFERLPPVSAPNRRDAALRWLTGAAPQFDPGERSAMVEAVLSVIDDPSHAALFGPNSLAEVPFSGLVDGLVIAGTIDRLLVTDGRVAVVDFKTGSFVPETAEQVPSGYLRQMAAYAAALQVIFPGHSIDAALLFTSGPRLVPIPQALLDVNKPGLGNAKTISAEPG